MDRPALDRAINTLQLALHPNTGDGEVLGAVYAFRRVANGETLTDICLKRFSTVETGRTYKRWQNRLDTMECENRKLKNDLSAAYQALAHYQHRNQELEAQLSHVPDAVEEPDVAEIQNVRVEVNVSIEPQPPFPPFDEASADSFEDAKAKRIRWRPDEWEFLAMLYEADPKIKNQVFADRCTEHFGRTISLQSIAGAIDRLRKRGRLPQYREGYKHREGYKRRKNPNPAET